MNKLFVISLPALLLSGCVTMTPREVGVQSLKGCLGGILLGAAVGMDDPERLCGKGAGIAVAGMSNERDEYGNRMSEQTIERRLMNIDPKGRPMSCTYVGLNAKDAPRSCNNMPQGFECVVHLYPYEVFRENRSDSYSRRSSRRVNGVSYRSSSRSNRSRSSRDEVLRNDHAQASCKWWGPDGRTVEGVQVIDLHATVSQQGKVINASPEIEFKSTTEEQGAPASEITPSEKLKGEIV